MAEATDASKLDQTSYIYEALRLLNSTNIMIQHKLFHNLQNELVDGQRYIQYLIKCRQHLLFSLEMVETLRKRIFNERELCMRNLILCCVRIFFEKRGQMLNDFYDEFSKLQISDEKIELMQEFINSLMDGIYQDGILRGVITTKESDVRECLEKIILQRVYQQLMFPNDDADKSRDL